MKSCAECRQNFEITEADRKVLQKFNAPEPQLCPDCRMQRRVAFRNETNFHKATCALTGKAILTSYPAGRGYKIMSSEAWYSDQWDPLEYGRDFDFNRPFFEQMGELIKAAPHINLMNNKSENCDYCNFCLYSRNCYLCTRVVNAEHCYYTYLPLDAQHCVDCYYIRKSQHCYQAIDCSECYNVTFSQRLQTCRNVSFSMDCIGCEDCFGCVGLRHKKNHFFNQPLSPEAYRDALQKLDLGSSAFTQKIRERFYQQEVLKRPLKYAVIENSENAHGNYIFSSRNITNSFDVSDCEDVRHSWGLITSKDMMDVYASHDAEEAYNTVSVTECRLIRTSYATFTGCYDLEYCFEVANNVKNCFGCVGLKHKQFCILNKQYSEVEYHALRAKIIEHMRATGEYGEYFPLSLSPFAYNETVAQEYFPLSRQDVERSGFFWFEEAREAKAKTYTIPDHIREVKDDILEAVLTCSKTGRPYRLIPQELKFYREHNLPIPRLCPAERHLERLRLRGPRKLWDRSCQKCAATIQTMYAPDRPEQVVCEACYLKEVY